MDNPKSLKALGTTHLGIEREAINPSTWEGEQPGSEEEGQGNQSMGP